MSEITKKLRDKHLAEFKPLAEQMASEGADEQTIVRAYQAWVRQRASNAYADKRLSMTPLQDLFNGTLAELERADSKIEMIFYELLQESGVPFQFQRKVGPYRIDYLVAGYLVVELDGPQHNQERDKKRDAYLARLGYRILRIPVRIMVTCPAACIESIKEQTKIRRVK